MSSRPPFRASCASFYVASPQRSEFLNDPFSGLAENDIPSIPAEPEFPGEDLGQTHTRTPLAVTADKCKIQHL